jgi:hypothetical protein
LRRGVWIAALSISLCACGPFTAGEPPDERATAGAPDGGAPQAGASDAGPSVGESVDGGVPQVFSAHDLKIEGLSGDVVYAHAIKAKQVVCDEIVIVADQELPDWGDDDVHTDVISASEVRVHDVEASWVHAGTLYVHKLEKK